MLTNLRHKDFRPLSVRHAKGTPPEIWNGVDWRALVKSRPPNRTQIFNSYLAAACPLTSGILFINCDLHADWKCYHGWTETLWRWWVRRSSLGQATRLTSRWRWKGRCRCRYLNLCTVHCSVKYIVAVVYVRLHILISSLPLFKSPKKYRFHKKFPYFKGNNLKVSIGVLLDIFFLW